MALYHGTGFKASSRPDPIPLPPGHHPCPRCGLVREARKGSHCEDCRYFLAHENDPVQEPMFWLDEDLGEW